MSSRLNTCDLFGCLKFVRVHHFFNVKERASKIISRLIWPTYFDFPLA